MSEMSTRPSHAPLRARGDRALAARNLGQMTAAMHALPRSHRPKVLRIALVRGGAIVDERVVRDLRDVPGMMPPFLRPLAPGWSPFKVSAPP